MKIKHVNSKKVFCMECKYCKGVEITPRIRDSVEIKYVCVRYTTIIIKDTALEAGGHKETKYAYCENHNKKNNCKRYVFNKKLKGWRKWLFVLRGMITDGEYN